MRPRNHHPTLTHPTVRQPTPIPFFPLSLSISVSLSPSSSCHLSALSSCPSSCLWQPYKPWSSAGASSFTRAMYPDVSEGRNFASVCVLPPSLSPLSLSRSLSPLSAPPLSSTLCSLPLSIFRSCKVRASVCARAWADACAAYVCAPRYTCVIPGHTYEGKFGLRGMLDGYVSERYPTMKVSSDQSKATDTLCPCTSVSLLGLPARDGSCEIRWIPLLFSLL